MQVEFTRAQIAEICSQLRSIVIGNEHVFGVEVTDGMLTAIITLRRPGWSADVPMPLVESERPKREQEKKTARKRKS